MSVPQTLFLLAEEEEAFYGGAVGGGKTAALLMSALRFVDVPGYAALILRRTFQELEQPGNVIPQSLQWFATVPEPTRPVYNKTEHIWTFPSGAVIRFGHLDSPGAMMRYQGGGYHMLGFDELTHFTQEAYEFIGFSRTRRPPTGPLSQVPIHIRATANPGGTGHLWVKQRFITHRKPEVLFVPAKLDDNPGIDKPDYVRRLDKLDPILRQQLLDGDWGAFQGAAFTVTEEHLVDEFPLADSHDRFEAADYGLNGAPWALWCVDYEGNLVGYDMLYERDLIPSQLCPLILAKRAAGWGSGSHAYLDPSVWHRTGGVNRWGQPAMLADEFTDNGVSVLPANNDPRAGLIRVRELLRPDPEHPFPNWHPRAGQLGAPRMFFVRSRFAPVVEELRSAPLQPIDKRSGGEIIDPEWESRYGHSVAMTRYACMTRPEPSTEPQSWRQELLEPVAPAEELRAQVLRRREELLDRPPRRRPYTRV